MATTVDWESKRDVGFSHKEVVPISPAISKIRSFL